MKKEYFIIGIKKEQQLYYSVWINSKVDALLSDESKKIILFKSIQDLANYCMKYEIILSPNEPYLYKYDKLKKWIESDKKKINCKRILDFWNLFSDISASLDLLFIGNERDKLNDKIYDKVFAGNNLPSMTPESKKYIPLWSKKEIKRIRELMQDGINILENNNIVL